jgi:hypothetical protein
MHAVAGAVQVDAVNVPAPAAQSSVLFAVDQRLSNGGQVPCMDIMQRHTYDVPPWGIEGHHHSRAAPSSEPPA